MSLQPNRVINRIVEQVDRANWPRLQSEVYALGASGETLRIYRAKAAIRYATPLHFWAHALRDELSATSRRADFLGAAGHALCRGRSIGDWHDELAELWRQPGVAYADAYSPTILLGHERRPEVYLMLESECRRSSVLATGDGFMADFWGHGGAPTWRQTSQDAARS